MGLSIALGIVFAICIVLIKEKVEKTKFLSSIGYKGFMENLLQLK